MTTDERRIGVLIPPVNVTVEPELNRWAPPGVTIHAARMWRRRGTLPSCGTPPGVDVAVEDHGQVEKPWLVPGDGVTDSSPSCSS